MTVPEHDAQVPGVVGEALQREAELQQGESLAAGASFSALSAALNRESGLRAWLRSRSTRTRHVLMGVTTLGTILAVLKFSVRPDLSEAAGRVTAALLIYGCAAGGAITLALRPLHRSGWPRNIAGIVLAAGIGGALGLALLPIVSGQPLPGPTGAVAGSAMNCFVWGTILSAPLLALGWLLERGGDNLVGRLLLTGGAAGLVGNLYLECHCPAQSPNHMMLGHVTVIFGMLALGLLLAFIPPRAGRQSVD